MWKKSFILTNCIDALVLAWTLNANAYVKSLQSLAIVQGWDKHTVNYSFTDVPLSMKNR